MAAGARKTIRVFVASPDDVRAERDAVRRCVAQLSREFRYHFDLDVVMWEWQPILADAHSQAQLVPPRLTDITIVILWSRLGSPLPALDFPGAVSGGAVTGTEWEFEDALASFRATHAPEVLVYRKRGEVLAWRDDDRERREEGERQLHLVDTFFDRWFGPRDDGGANVAFRAFRETSEFETMLTEHLRALLRPRIEAIARPVRWHSGSPYRGLLPFEPEHADIFFGRAVPARALRDLLETRLNEGNPFVLIVGASGSGKSSLVKAALIPALVAGSWLGGIGLCRHVIIRPSDHPNDLLLALAGALLADAVLPELRSLGFATPDALARLLRESPIAALAMMAQALRSRGTAARLPSDQRTALLIVVDQLEEIFGSEVDPEARRTAFRVLSILALESARQGSLNDNPPVMVVATMRSDFFDRLESVPELAALGATGHFVVRPPDSTEIGQMIRAPAEMAGLQFEFDATTGRDLADEIRAVAERDTRVLPLLGFLLDQLWHRRTSAGVLTFAAYRELGSLEGALALRAEEVLGELSADAQASLSVVLSRLTVVQMTSESAADSQRRVTAAWANLDEFAGGTPARELVDAFLRADARLFVAEGDRATTRIRVAHEALLSHWERAAHIIERDGRDLALSARLEEAESMWRSAQPAARASRLLPAGLPLDEAKDLLRRRCADLRPSLVQFITDSVEVERQGRDSRLRHLRRVAAAFAIIALIALVFGGLALRYSAQARAQEQAATRETEQLKLLTRFFQEIFEGIGLGSGKFDQTVVAALESSASGVEERFQAQPEIAIRVRLALASGLWHRGEVHKAEVEYNKARAIASASTIDPRLAIEVEMSYGFSLGQLERFVEAEKILRTALAQSESRFGPTEPITLKAAAFLLSSMWKKSDLAEPCALVRHYRSIADRVLPANSDDALLLIQFEGAVLTDLGRLDEALPVLELAYERRLAASGPKNLQTIACAGNLAIGLLAADRTDDAQQLIEGVDLTNAPQEHWVRASWSSIEARILDARGQPAAAAELLGATIKKFEPSPEIQRWRIARLYELRATCLDHAGQTEEAVADTRKALELLLRVFDSEHRLSRKCREQLNALEAKMAPPQRD